MWNINTLIKNTHLLFLVLFITNMIDAATTATLIHWGGLEVEVNPFMRAIIGSFGAYGMVAYKGCALMFLWFVHDIVKTHSPQLLRPLVLCIAVVCAVYVVLATHNMILVYHVWSNLM